MKCSKSAYLRVDENLNCSNLVEAGREEDSEIEEEEEKLRTIREFPLKGPQGEHGRHVVTFR